MKTSIQHLIWLVLTVSLFGSVAAASGAPLGLTLSKYVANANSPIPSWAKKSHQRKRERTRRTSRLRQLSSQDKSAEKQDRAQRDQEQQDQAQQETTINKH